MIVESKMLKKLLISAAVSALLTGTSVAQAPQSSDPESSTTSGQGTAQQQQVVMQQAADQFLASKFKGTDVLDSKNESIGSVNDVLFDKDGKILAYVVGVGGFLGIGAKNVALNPSAFQMQSATDEGSTRLKLAMTKDELKAMPEFKPYQEPRASTVGQGGPTTRMAPPSGATAPGTPPAPRQ
jgi:hypothetical protein